jgi:hypothetical protein
MLKVPARTRLVELDLLFELFDPGGTDSVILRTGTTEHLELDDHVLLHLGHGVFTFAGLFSFRWARSLKQARKWHGVEARPVLPDLEPPIWSPPRGLLGDQLDPDSVSVFLNQQAFKSYGQEIHASVSFEHQLTEILAGEPGAELRVVWTHDGLTSESAKISHAWFGNTGPDFPTQRVCNGLTLRAG